MKNKRFILSIDGKMHSYYQSIEDACLELAHIKPHYLDAKRFQVIDAKTGKEVYKHTRF